MSLWGPSKPYVDRVVPADEIALAIKRAQERAATGRADLGARHERYECPACGVNYSRMSVRKHYCRKGGA